MFRILHLSDIHIGRTYKEPDSIACKITSDIANNGLSGINCVVVTGDIFDGQAGTQQSLIDIAVDFFETLLSEINSNQEKSPIGKGDIIFVPGNHDMIRDDDCQKRWCKYHDFLERFYGSIPSYYYLQNYALFKKYEQQKIVFVGFNSCQIEKRNLFDDTYIKQFEKYINENTLAESGIDKEKIIDAMKSSVADQYDDYGYIPLSQITPIERKVRKLDDYVVVALFHHHFYLFPEVAKQFGDSSLIRNYTEVIQHLKYMNVSVVLHGHKHFALERPYIMDDYYESGNNIIDVFSGGSVGTDRKEEHTFGVLDLYEKKEDIKLKHNKFVYNGENLEPIIKKQVPPQKLSSRVVKLMEILKMLNPEEYEFYEETAEKAFKSYDSCNKIISWVSEAITGFTDVYKYLDSDYNNILFLLYAINYRTISYMKIVGKEESYFIAASETWRSFYETKLEPLDFTIPKQDYHKLFMDKKLKSVASYCDKLLNDCTDKKSQIYLAFTMLGVFFTDLYLVLTKYADDFKASIQYKVNIKIEKNKFHQNVPAPRIVVHSDADRRSAYIELLCNEATAHKMAVLFIKEFDLLINKFEDYFKIIGLKLYYLLPRIDKDRMKNTLDNYNFEAYIPTLIPLLTGDNIYSSKEVFARELIQNSIDAISVREAKDKTDFSKNILIEIGVEQNKKRYFKIVDRGTGMDRYKIERYFTSIGRSFYAGEEYEELNISYKPISNFGIGFLSSFMVCREIDVKTQYYIDGSEGLKLHIPNYDGCFFIELDKEAHVGTEIKLYLNKDVDDKSIIDYIQRTMQDIKYTIDIQYNEVGNERKISIPAHAVRKRESGEKFEFFIPFSEKGEVGTIDYQEILNNEYIHKYEYGLLIRKRENVDEGDLVLNSGISVEKASVGSVFGRRFANSNHGYDLHNGKREYNNFVVNFPANWLQLDVSRENITEISIMNDDIFGKIAESLYQQLVQYIQYIENKETNIAAIYLQDVIRYACDFCGESMVTKELCEKLENMKYKLSITFTERGICYQIGRQVISEERIILTYSNKNAKVEHDKFKLQMKRNKRKKYSSVRDNLKMSGRELSVLLGREIYSTSMFINDKIRYVLNHLIRSNIGVIHTGEEKKDLFVLLSLFLVDPSDDILSDSSKEDSIVTFLELVFLEYFHIGSEENQKEEITYDEMRNAIEED
jgi:hypothetical protein